MVNGKHPIKITVLIPTFRRSRDLERCLEALKKQTRSVDEVILVVRENDGETLGFLETRSYQPLPVVIVPVTLPGQVAALNAGIQVARGEIISITDDDTAPHPDWLERIEARFLADNSVGGVGGRDRVFHGSQLEEGSRSRVGKVQWFGRVIGNHHLGVGEAREVDVLKGANMSYRRSAIGPKRFDERLRGTGAQVHNDLAFSLALKREGWKLIYDPLVLVDHFPGDRFDRDRREEFNYRATSDKIYNETLVLLEYLSAFQRSIFLVWAVLIGTYCSFGFLQFCRFLPTEKTLAVKKFLASLQGRWQGWRTWKELSRELSDRSLPANSEI